jgi:7-cyano-7-deazaguanine reductase
MLENSPLGQTTSYKNQYDPRLLFPVARSKQRQNLSMGDTLPFDGVDIWNGYEFSWLDNHGKPQVALFTMTNPCTSPNIIESKSLKLYLNSFNLSRFATSQEVLANLTRDLSQAVGAPVGIALQPLPIIEQSAFAQLPGDCLDDLPITVTEYRVNPRLLQMNTAVTVSETLHTHLFKSNCLMTGQPDWGSVLVRYHGSQIVSASLLKYLISYREHAEFHEHCVERVFMDILHQCQPSQLTVYARFTRRGGLDINPFRSNFEAPYGNLRLIRQ